VKEEALLLGPHQSLVGVYTPAVPGGARAADEVAVVLLNPGLIHHVGPHRLHVKLARALAARGISALRVDLSGIGDSSSRSDNLPAARVGFHEPKEILDSLAQRGHRHFVLFGICSGAKHALQAVTVDRRIKGLVLVNPESAKQEGAQSEQVSAQYYLRRSFWNPRAWLNLFTGRVRYKPLFAALAGELRRKVDASGRKTITPTEIVRTELEPALAQGCRLLVVFSDRHAQFAKLLGDGLQDLQRDCQLEMAVYPEADHLFTAMRTQDALVQRVCQWAQTLAGPQAAVAGSAGAKT
jgi:dienelactone hydrolase